MSRTFQFTVPSVGLRLSVFSYRSHCLVLLPRAMGKKSLPKPLGFTYKCYPYLLILSTQNALIPCLFWNPVYLCSLFYSSALSLLPFLFLGLGILLNLQSQLADVHHSVISDVSSLKSLPLLEVLSLNTVSPSP